MKESINLSRPIVFPILLHEELRTFSISIINLIGKALLVFSLIFFNPVISDMSSATLLVSSLESAY